MPTQQHTLPLPRLVSEHLRLQDFQGAIANPVLMHTLQTSLQTCCEDFQSLWIWGAPGTGLSELAMLWCQAVHQAGHALVDIDAQDDESLSMLASASAASVLCCHRVDVIMQDRTYCEALFHAYNQALLRGHGRWLITSHEAPAQSKAALPDWLSRMKQSNIFHLNALTRDQQHEALMKRAHDLGHEVSSQAIDYFMKRYRGSQSTMFRVFESLLQYGYAHKRRITVPLIQRYLNLEQLADDSQDGKL